MTRPLTSVLRARQAAGLSLDLLSRMTGLSPERLGAFEAGIILDPSEIDAVARAFGVRIKDLTGSTPENWPLSRLVFRAGETGATALAALVEDGSYAVLGEFLRCVADLHEVEKHPENPRCQLTGFKPPVGWEEGPPWGTTALAQEVRLRADLSPTERIPSVRGLLEQFDVACFFTTPERLSPSVDAASTLFPRPAVLINLIEGERAWWRTRMSLAHELCHLLLDHSDELPATLSPEHHVRHRYVYFADLLILEKRANAFAAQLLAPDAGLRELVADLLPSSREAVAAVGRRFGVGRIVAVNRLTNVYQLSAETRRRMVDRGGERWETEGEFEQEVQVGLRNGVLLRSALTAYSARVIDAVEVRRVLDIDLTEPLPAWEGLEASELRPLRPPKIQVLATAGQFLAANERRHLVAVRPRHVENGWEVDIEGGDEPMTLMMSFDYQVTPPKWLAA